MPGGARTGRDRTVPAGWPVPLKKSFKFLKALKSSKLQKPKTIKSHTIKSHTIKSHKPLDLRRQVRIERIRLKQSKTLLLKHKRSKCEERRAITSRTERLKRCSV
jgi:hypothetical protein